MINNIKVLESVLVSSHRPDNPPYIQGGRVSVKVTLNEFSNAMISANVTASRRTILQLYDWVAANYGTIISPRRFSNGTYTTASSFALDVFKTLKEVNADNSARSDVREALESYSHMTVPGMDPTAVIDTCLHNLALTRSRILSLGACAPTSDLAEGKDMIRDALRSCLELMEE